MLHVGHLLKKSSQTYTFLKITQIVPNLLRLPELLRLLIAEEKI